MMTKSLIYTPSEIGLPAANAYAPMSPSICHGKFRDVASHVANLPVGYAPLEPPIVASHHSRQSGMPLFPAIRKKEEERICLCGKETKLSRYG